LARRTNAFDLACDAIAVTEPPDYGSLEVPVNAWFVAIGVAMSGQEADGSPTALRVPARVERGDAPAGESLKTIVLRDQPVPERPDDGVLGDAHCIVSVAIGGAVVEGSPTLDCDDALRRVSTTAVSKWSADPLSMEPGAHYSFLVRISFDRTQTLGRISTGALAEPSSLSGGTVKVKSRVLPQYPASGDGRTVSCIVHYAIDSEGVPQWAAVFGCPDIYRRTIESAAMRWRFYPFRMKGKASAVEFDVPIELGPTSTGWHYTPG
jgi:hypothetical protein